MKYLDDTLNINFLLVYMMKYVLLVIDSPKIFFSFFFFCYLKLILRIIKSFNDKIRKISENVENKKNRELK